MKAILVKVLPATNTKPTRMKATADGVRSIVRGVQFGWGEGEKAAAVLAQDLCEVYGWGGTLASGQLASGDWVFCFVENDTYRQNIYPAIREATA